MIKISVGDIMTRQLLALDTDASLHDCAKLMAKHRVNSVLIVKSKKLIGIITARDILWTITKQSNINLKSVLAIKIATKKVAVIKPSADINQALIKMISLNFRRLPVLSKGNIIGMITIKDILKVDPSLYSKTGELMKIREEEEKMIKTKTEGPIEGFCEECNAFSDLLNVEGRALCADCREELY